MSVPLWGDNDSIDVNFINPYLLKETDIKVSGMSDILAVQHGQTFPYVATTPVNLPQALLSNDPQTPIVYLDSVGNENNQSYGNLIEQAQCIASGLQSLGLTPGQKLLLQLVRSEDILPTFWGALFAGLEPIIVPIPISYDIASRATEQLEHIWTLLDKPLICATTALLPSLINSEAIKSFGQAETVSLESLRDFAPKHEIYQAGADEVAFYTLSSGSTGLPKIVALSHKNLISRALGTNALCGNSNTDVILSWLPFDHIGNISAYHISPVIEGSALVYAQKEYVLGKPLRWLEIMERHKVTHSWAPNFAFALVTKALKAYVGPALDLSRVKGLLTAGELIAYSTVNDFLEACKPHGFRRNALISAFGMAEVCSGITYHLPSDDNAIRFIHIDRNYMSGKIRQVPSGDKSCISFASLGTVIDGVSIRIVDEDNQLIPEETVGRFQIKGDALMPGYYRNPIANEAFVGDGWFDTGDAAFISKGELVLLGRAGLGIIINGANLSNNEIETATEQVKHVSASFTAACAAFRKGSDRLSLVLFFHTDLSEDHELSDLIRQIQSKLSQHLGVKADYLVPLEREAIPKTAIGKIQHKRLIQQFQAGDFDKILEKIQGLIEKQTSIAPSVVDHSPKSEIEQKITHILQNVLGLDQIALNDNFFELGGDSLSLLQVHEQLTEVFGPGLSLVDLFTAPSIETLARRLSGSDTQASPTELGQARAQARSQSKVAGRSNDVAVIGMSCRFPGAENIDAFWENLVNGVESITFFDKQDLLNGGFSPSVFDRDEFVKASPMIKDARGFDAEFFGYSARDAELMDPQQRLFLECAWEAFEVAGYDPTTYPGVTGVYAGAAMNTYLMNNIFPNRQELDPQDDLNVMTLDSMGGFMMMVANDKDYLTTRVSYKLNLSGPSVNVQTACSTGLVTVHMACQSLIAGETDLFLTGAASIQSPEHAGHLYQPGMILSPDGHVRSFDADARGTIFGSGVGAILLKRLDDAVRDGDHIFAVVKGSAVNNDAGMKVGYMAPSSDGQAVAVAEAIAAAQVLPDTIGFVEAHGTGTEIGDPIEFDGLSQVFRKQTQALQFCALGSVKTNLGHLQITSGIAGFIKTALALHHKVIPPTLHFKTPNPGLRIEQSPFFINSAPVDWPRHNDTPRRAGVNSLGIGGTNAHAILEEAPEQSTLQNPLERPAHLLMLSARTEPALRQLAGRYAKHFAHHPDIDLANACFTANTGRKAFGYRIALIASNVQAMSEQLMAFEFDKPLTIGHRIHHSEQSTHKIGFLFTGQGSQYPNMGRELYESQPLFRRHMEECAQLFEPLIGINLVEQLFNEHAPEQSIDQTIFAQPSIFSVEFALAKLWQSWGVLPDYVMGHSLGEYVAACLAGVFSLSDAIRLVATRAQLMQSLERSGEMWVVFASIAQITPLVDALGEEISIAADNGPENVVISGTSEVISRLIPQLEQASIRLQRLNTSHAFHSGLMDPILEAFERVAQTVTYHKPTIKLVSNLTGLEAGNEITATEYWRKHIRQTVNFRASIQHLASLGCNIFIEIGPKPTLTGLGTQCITSDALWLASIKPSESNWVTMLDSLGQLAVRIKIDLKNLDQGYHRKRLPLPTYPFQHVSYWMEPPKLGTAERVLKKPQTTLLGLKLRLPNVRSTVFQTQFNTDALPFLNDHLVYATPVVSGACHIAMMLDAGKELYGNHAFSLVNIHFPEPLVIEPSTSKIVQLTINPESANNFSGQLSSFDAHDIHNDNNIEQHATADYQPEAVATVLPCHLTDLYKQCSETVDIVNFYQSIQDRMISLGASYRWVKSIHLGERQAIGAISQPVSRSGLAESQLHPGLLDAGFSLLLAMGMHGKGETWLPFAIERVRVIQATAETPSHVYLKLRDASNGENAIADVIFCDLSGNVLLELVGLQARKSALKNFKLNTNRRVRELLHEEIWTTVPSEQNHTRTLNNDAAWLVLADRGGFGEQLAKQMEQEGQRCVVMYAAENSTDWRQQQLDPTCAEDIFAAVKQVSNENKALNGILHLWSLDQPTSSDDATRYQHRTSASALYTVQACISLGLTIHQNIALMTQGVHLLETDQHRINIEQAPLWGIGLTGTLEYPDLKLMCLDLDPLDREQAARAVWKLLKTNQKEKRVALRNSTAYFARLRIADSVKSKKSANTTTIASSGTYLITGATGGLGMLTASWLVSEGAKHLALISRSQPSADVLDAINKWHTQGVTATHYATDIADSAALSQSLLAIEKTDQPLRGLFHCAGTLNDRSLAEQSWESFEAVYATKVQGSRNLHLLTKDLDLDIFVMYSSAASLLGNRGQANYAAANAYMDALATYRRQLGLSANSINWGPWAEVGMVQSDEKIKRSLSILGFTPLTSELSLTALRVCLELQDSRMAVMNCDWSRYASSSESVDPYLLLLNRIDRNLNEQAAGDQNAEYFSNTLRSSNVQQRRMLIVELLNDSINRILGTDASVEPPADRPLTDQGFDSLMAVQLTNALGRKLNQRLPVSIVFNYPTVTNLTDYLLTLYEEKLASNEANNDNANASDAAKLLLQDLEQLLK